MKIPNFRRIFSTDFEAQYKKLMDQLGIIFNGGFEPLYNALNNNLTFQDNFLGTVIDVLVTVDDTGTPTQPVSFKMQNKQTIANGIICINARGAKDSSVFPTAGVTVSFDTNSNVVTIRNVTGLSAGVQYKLKLVCLT